MNHYRFLILAALLLTAVSPALAAPSAKPSSAAKPRPPAEEARWHYLEGERLRQTGDLTGAIAQWNETLRLKPDSAPTRQALDQAKALLRKKAGAPTMTPPAPTQAAAPIPPWTMTYTFVGGRIEGDAGPDIYANINNKYVSRPAPAGKTPEEYAQIFLELCQDGGLLAKREGAAVYTAEPVAGYFPVNMRQEAYTPPTAPVPTGVTTAPTPAPPPLDPVPPGPWAYSYTFFGGGMYDGPPPSLKYRKGNGPDVVRTLRKPTSDEEGATAFVSICQELGVKCVRVGHRVYTAELLEGGSPVGFTTERVPAR